MQIQAHFHFRLDWYREGEVRALVKQYYVVLRSVLRSRPDVRRCLSRCRHCRIFFLTHPRNAGRRDLRCPFGCRDAHRKRRSTERSVAYYATSEGKVKKKMQNGKRAQGGIRTDTNLPVPGASEFPAGMVGYVHHLAANLLIFHNVVTMTKALKQLLTDGHEIDEAALACFSPYQTEHLNRFGRYTLKRDRVPEPLDRARVLRMPPRSEGLPAEKIKTSVTF